MTPEQDKARHIADLAVSTLEDMKATDIVCIDVRHLTSLMDIMIVASGRSDRHVRAIAAALIESCKAASIPIGSKEGQEGGEWLLVDLIDVVVHVMLPKTRDFYELEKLWDISPPGEHADRSRLRLR